MSALRILLVDDNPDDRLLVIRELRRELAELMVDQIVGPEEFEEALSKGEFDLVITDYQLRWTTGLDVLRQVKERWPDVPVIMFTATGSEEIAVEAMKSGLDDYILKSPKHFARIPAAVRLVLERSAQRRRLVEAENRFRNLVQRLPVGIYRLDSNGRILDANPALARMLGYGGPEAVVGKCFWDFFANRSSLQEWRQALEREGRLAGFEYELNRRDGDTVWVSDHCVAVKNATGGGVVYEGVIQDVTARRLAEQSLRDERNLLQTILDNALDYIFVKDRNGRFLLANRAHVRGLGANSLSEVIGKTAFDFHPHELAQRYYADDQQVVETGQPIVNRLEPFVDGSGNERWLLTTKLPLRDSEGNVVGIVGLSRDITDLRKMELERNRLALAVDRAADAIIVLDEKLRVIYANRAYAELLGRPLSEIVGQDANALGPIEVDPTTRERIGRDLREKGSWSGQLTAKRPGGEAVYDVSVSVFQPENSTEGERNYVVVVHDLTQVRELERQLERAQRLEAIGRLAGGIAHDFNNVLTAITGYADLVMMDLDPNDPVRKDVEEIKKAANRAATLTRQLLAFGRKLVMQPRVLNLNELIENLSKMLRRLIGEDIDFITDLDPDLGNINADPAQIEQVIVNLAVNARDAMPEGGKLIIETRNVVLDEEYARTHVDVKPGNYVMMAVSDTGVGMDEETKAHIFEPFFTTKEGEGTGLGLAQVYGIVKQSGGHINVYSEPGHGTAFRIYLPRVDAPVETALEEEERARDLRGRETILLVEDDETVRDLARSVLTRFGYRVLEARSPGDALLLSERYEGQIDLLLTDVIMPGMNGKELAERLVQQRPGMKVIFSSGYTDNVIASHGLLEPGMEFVSKPFAPDVLLRKVREVLDRED